MLKRLRSAHPMLYCLVAEVLFLGMLFVASLLSLLLILFVVRDIDAVDDYMLTFMQEAVGVLVAWLFLARTGKSGLLRRRGSGLFRSGGYRGICRRADTGGAAAFSTVCWWACTLSRSSATTPTILCCLAGRRAICCLRGMSCGSLSA